MRRRRFSPTLVIRHICKGSSAERTPSFQIRHARVEAGTRRPARSAISFLLLGACTSISLRTYANLKNWRLGAIKIVLELRRHAGSYYIERGVSLSGAISREQRAELARVCEATPVTLAVKHGITIHTRLAAPSAR